MLPKPLVSHLTDIVWSGHSLNANDHKACLHFHKFTQLFELPVFKFQQSFLTTVGFEEWWADYQRQAFYGDLFLQNMIDAFSILTGEIPPPPPTTNAPDITIQTNNTDEVPKKVTIILSLFLSLQKAKIQTLLFSIVRVEKGFRQLNQPLANLQRGRGRHRLRN